MSKAQQQGVSANTIWLIVFAALWLAAMVLVVVMYTGQEELARGARGDRDSRARLASADEERTIPLIRGAVMGGPTAVGLLEKARRETAKLASANGGNDDVTTIRTKRDELLATIRGEGLVTDAGAYAGLSFHEALGRLYESYKDQANLRRQAQDLVKGLQGEVDALSKINAKEKDDFDQRARAMEARFSEAETARTRARDERNQAVEQIESEFETRRKQSDADLTQTRRRLAETEKRLTGMQSRFEAQQRKFGELMIGPEELATARKADGTVLTAVPGDDIVYINLGRKDRLTLGIQFAVYAQETGIPADGRSKGQIEVVSFTETSAACRIVRTHGNSVVLEGDLVANPVYDPARPPSFLVLGAFDLNRDGTPEPAGADAIEAIIKDWGGSVASELTALTDFVVLGAIPRRPVRRSDPTPEQARQAQAQQNLREHYEHTVETAKALSVPVMPQEVFLNFLGYSGRYASR